MSSGQISSNGTNSPDTIFFLSLSDIGGNSGVGVGAAMTGPGGGNAVPTVATACWLVSGAAAVVVVRGGCGFCLSWDEFSWPEATEKASS